MAVAAGCASNGNPAAPTAAPVNVPVTYVEFRGLVLDTSFESVPGVTVEILDGVASGTSAVSGANSIFSIMVPTNRDVTLRFSKDGYVPSTPKFRAPSSRYELETVFLTPERQITPIETGAYTLTLSADAACGMPANLRTQVFQARLDPVPGTVSGAMFHLEVDKQSAAYFQSYFTFGVAGQRLGFYRFSDPLLEWQIGSSTYFSAGPAAEKLTFTEWNPNLLSFPANFMYGELTAPPPLYLAWWDSPNSQFSARGQCGGRISLTR